LQPDDVVVLFTDGLSEARRPTDRAFFDVGSAAATLLQPDRLQAGVVALRDAAARWTGEALHDDVAIVAVRHG
jgi:serine phosphatase RsbU (regulator of sigma subunit)